MKYSLWNTGRTIRQNGVAFWWICQDADKYPILYKIDNHPLFDTFSEAANFLRIMLTRYNWMTPYEWVIAEFDKNRDETNTKEIVGYKVKRDIYGIPMELVILEPK